MNRVLKYLSFGTVALLVLVLVVSTVIVAVNGSVVAQENIYSSPFFVALWCAVFLFSLLYIFSTPVKRVAATLFLHLALAVVLVGAFVTYMTAERGSLALCEGAAPASMFMKSDGSLAKFPFRITLQGSRVELGDDGVSPLDYVAELSVQSAAGESEAAVLSMNKVYDREGYHFCLSQVVDGSVTLLVSYDPWGTAITYTGYLLTVLGFLFVLVARNTQKAALTKLLYATGYPRVGISSHRLSKLIFISLFLFVVITYFGIRRWADTGVFPVSTGAEVLMFIAWCAFLSVVFLRKNRSLAMGVFCYAVMCAAVSRSSGVASSGWVLPVLRTPLLPLHVVTIVTSYLFIGLLTVNALVSLIVYWLKGNRERLENTALSGRVMLYYAVWLLVAGIFLGAAWADIAWGRYWGWDPKEVWALITLLVCSFGFHTRSLPFMARPLVFHCFCLVAFLVMLFTFFGVNYLLGGLHSYA
ncbi:MAG: cytochrome c biogenesis protein CcsA [Bacteroidaceae bacterium]|nr:cytochrome c biogenesis protein CcsA [Bacteroidaceae bacterium]